jgi:hypothetical protein
MNPPFILFYLVDFIETFRLLLNWIISAFLHIVNGTIETFRLKFEFFIPLYNEGFKF